MNDHKPFTPDELDSLERDALSPTFRRLVAEAREANRLREGRSAFVECWGNYGPYGGASNEPCGWSGPMPANKVCPTCYAGYLKPIEDPAARAKRELGEWLAERGFRMHLWLEYAKRCGPTGRFQFSLRDCGTRIDGQCCATEAEAITATLRAAKERGR